MSNLAGPGTIGSPGVLRGSGSLPRTLRSCGASARSRILVCPRSPNRFWLDGGIRGRKGAPIRGGACLKRLPVTGPLFLVARWRVTWNSSADDAAGEVTGFLPAQEEAGSGGKNTPAAALRPSRVDVAG